MPELRLQTTIAASPQACFDLSLSVDAHTESMGRSRERAVAGRTEGRLGAGDQVTWRAVHFGVPFRMTSTISEYDAPYRFVDEQTRGPFRSWHHEHRFLQLPDGRTSMIDEIRYASPFGPIGAAVDQLFLSRYLERLIRVRNEWLRSELEPPAG